MPSDAELIAMLRRVLKHMEWEAEVYMAASAVPPNEIMSRGYWMGMHNAALWVGSVLNDGRLAPGFEQEVANEQADDDGGPGSGTG